MWLLYIKKYNLGLCKVNTRSKQHGNTFSQSRLDLTTGHEFCSCSNLYAMFITINVQVYMWLKTTAQGAQCDHINLQNIWQDLSTSSEGHKLPFSCCAWKKCKLNLKVVTLQCLKETTSYQALLEINGVAPITNSTLFNPFNFFKQSAKSSLDSSAHAIHMLGGWRYLQRGEVQCISLDVS